MLILPLFWNRTPDKHKVDMKFRIRYADKIVGFLVIIGLVSLIAVIFLLGSRQRWFARDYQYVTRADSASGLSQNMPVLLKGIQIGTVKHFLLGDDDMVHVTFTIYEEYNNRVKEGSLVQILASPIGLGNQFVFHPGLGTQQLEENDLIPTAASREGKELIARGLGRVPSQNDTVAILTTKINTLLDNVNDSLEIVNRAMDGDDTSVVGRTLGGVEKTVSALPGELEEIQRLTQSVNNVIEDISVISARLADPDGGAFLPGLESSITSLAGILSNLEKTTAYLPKEAPSMILEVRSALQAAEDVLVALRNNPLLRKGVPDRVETGAAGAGPRAVTF